MSKKYRSATGVEELYYAVLSEEGSELTKGDIQMVDYLQTIEIEMPQEPVRAFGSNRTAEIAIANGNISVSSAFHRIPQEDKATLFGLEMRNGLYAYGPDDIPPYVAVIFAKTFEDGSKEWVGLVKGIFMRPNIAGKTKEDGVEFSTDEVTAEFMERRVDSFGNEYKTLLMGTDERGKTDVRDQLFMDIFGKEFPGITNGGLKR
ncbi:major tail protein [Bacillus sp. FSL W7-1360]